LMPAVQDRFAATAVALQAATEEKLTY
jgi:hypothetical protein